MCYTTKVTIKTKAVVLLFIVSQLVILTQRVHPFPFRTRKLSSAVATILVGRPAGKIAHCQHPERARRDIWFAVCPFNHFKDDFTHG